MPNAAAGTPGSASLHALYASHVGKVSDKWASYLTLYDELFASRRQRATSILEIGVQNGGSLDIWAKYFPNAEHVTGCDINERCRQLAYDDPRIRVVVGDATDAAIAAKVVDTAGAFDIVIEDGSHYPADVIAAFLLYWPHVKPGGLFVAEDLHCDYFPSHFGSISRRDTANRFFAQLTHLINHEHWAGVVPLESLFRNFALKVPLAAANLIGSIASISFFNSVVVVRKAASVADTLLGERCIVGDLAAAEPAVLHLRSSGNTGLAASHERPAVTTAVPSFSSLFRS
jgi:predicted O-methyltransferase YrrM